ncbi:hypothetical protein L596_013143 [Steinernema carpocapsae]|uniref:Uncharacterized protein n=1 Tax=Steinernema carpocapsae TaxID=34508 RepID=A0A4U5NZB9_STECR|nr:hypothetical protein L596_013143 [Steinernema carpocapsae]
MRELSRESERPEDTALLKPPGGMSLSSVESARRRNIERTNCSLAKNSDRKQKRRIQIPETVTTSRRTASRNNQRRDQKRSRRRIHSDEEAGVSDGSLTVLPCYNMIERGPTVRQEPTKRS